MARYAVMNEETVAMRKEHAAFNNDITMSLQKLHGEYPFFNQEATNSGPGGTGPESVEEELEEEIVYRPPVKGRWKEENEETASETYEFIPRG
uniref:Putative ovule protein n=1 Tax=Solanum chacoense TaxID=4108 RepID=A0A0V0HK30_SOLCH